jgi:tetratricopeptide (TPR) repeat protein
LKYLAFLAILALLLAALPPGASRVDEAAAEGAGGDETAAKMPPAREQDITILLPLLEAKVSHVDSTADMRDLFRTLAVARGYLQLGLYEDAQGWFEHLAAIDSDSLLTDAIFDGRLASAVGLGSLDSLGLLMDEYGQGLERPDPVVMARALSLVGRGGRWDEAETLVDRALTCYGDRPPAELVYLKGRVLRRQGRLSEAVQHFERQLNAMRVPSAVDSTVVAQRARFIQGAADCSFLLNDRLHARALYGRLLGEDDPWYAAWGRFQLAQLDMLDSAYEEAMTGFIGVAGDSIGARFCDWAQDLAEHCAVMRQYRQYLIDTSPRPFLAAP